MSPAIGSSAQETEERDAAESMVAAQYLLSLATSEPRAEVATRRKRQSQDHTASTECRDNSEDVTTTPRKSTRSSISGGKARSTRAAATVRINFAELTAPSSAVDAPDGKTNFRGVFWDRKNCRWRSQVGFQNKKIFMGYFNDAEDAARAYDRKLVELHGSTAKTNFPIHEYLDEIVGHDAAVASKDVDMVQHPEAAGTSYRVMESPAQQAGLKQKRPMPGLREPSGEHMRSHPGPYDQNTHQDRDHLFQNGHLRAGPHGYDPMPPAMRGRRVMLSRNSSGVDAVRAPPGVDAVRAPPGVDAVRAPYTPAFRPAGHYDAMGVYPELYDDASMQQQAPVGRALHRLDSGAGGSSARRHRDDRQQYADDGFAHGWQGTDAMTRNGMHGCIEAVKEDPYQRSLGGLTRGHSMGRYASGARQQLDADGMWPTSSEGWMGSAGPADRFDRHQQYGYPPHADMGTDHAGYEYAQGGAGVSRQQVGMDLQRPSDRQQGWYARVTGPCDVQHGARTGGIDGAAVVGADEQLTAGAQDVSRSLLPALRRRINPSANKNKGRIAADDLGMDSSLTGFMGAPAAKASTAEAGGDSTGSPDTRASKSPSATVSTVPRGSIISSMADSIGQQTTGGEAVTTGFLGAAATAADNGQMLPQPLQPMDAASMFEALKRLAHKVAASDADHELVTSPEYHGDLEARVHDSSLRRTSKRAASLEADPCGHIASKRQSCGSSIRRWGSGVSCLTEDLPDIEQVITQQQQPKPAASAETNNQQGQAGQHVPPAVPSEPSSPMFQRLHILQHECVEVRMLEPQTVPMHDGPANVEQILKERVLPIASEAVMKLLRQQQVSSVAASAKLSPGIEAPAKSMLQGSAHDGMPGPPCQPPCVVFLAPVLMPYLVNGQQ
eukprot:jgi/Chrzof1/3091/Cz12g11120.t1